MTGNIYEVIRTEELNRGERVEMVVDIYESTDAVRAPEPTTEMENTSPKTTQQTQHPGSRCCGPAAVCLGLLCVLLLAAITVLWFMFTIERDQLHTSYTNLTIERDQLQTRYTNLTTERDQLQKDRDELKKKFSELGGGLGPLVPVKGAPNASADQEILDNFMFPTLWEQFGDGPFLFQHGFGETEGATPYGPLSCTNQSTMLEMSKSYEKRSSACTDKHKDTKDSKGPKRPRAVHRFRVHHLHMEKEEHIIDTEIYINNSLSTETYVKQFGWICLKSGLYYISTEKKSWRESRQDCIKRGADLVIINSREEQDFINRLRRDRTAWIGLSYSYTEGAWSWRWLDNSTVDTGFWSREQPYSHGYCAVTGYGSDPVFNWVNYNCSDQQYWICEKRVISQTTA
ncbi:hypothetical protein NFI96_021648, partial [Prochilodus magdalenae]